LSKKLPRATTCEQAIRPLGIDRDDDLDSDATVDCGNHIIEILDDIAETILEPPEEKGDSEDTGGIEAAAEGGDGRRRPSGFSGRRTIEEIERAELELEEAHKQEEEDENDGRTVEREEGQVPRQLVNRQGPTRREKEEHELTHIPYTSWCEQCVKGRGRKTAHARTKEEEKKDAMEAVSKVSIDF
jgi:hypothetical protein